MDCSYIIALDLDGTLLNTLDDLAASATYVVTSSNLLIDDVSGGVTIKHFTQNSMKKLSFPLPPIKEQYRIVSAINQYNIILDDISANL